MWPNKNLKNKTENNRFYFVFFFVFLVLWSFKTLLTAAYKWTEQPANQPSQLPIWLSDNILIYFSRYSRYTNCSKLSPLLTLLLLPLPCLSVSRFVVNCMKRHHSLKACLNWSEGFIFIFFLFILKCSSNVCSS